MLRYARSIAAVAIGLALALWAEPILDPSTVFLAGVIVAAWFGGLGPGLLAAILALLAVEYFFTPPFYSFEPRIQQVPRLLVFAVLAVLSAWGSAARKKAEDSLREARDELDARVLARTAELTRANERVGMQYAVTRVLAEAATLDSAMPQLLRIIGEAAAWEWGALWIIDREAGTLRCGPIWHSPDVQAPPFSAACRETAFAPGCGLPGMVWQSRAPLWLADVTADASFERIQSAAAAGLRGAIGFPVLFSGEILGVIEFFSRLVRQPDAEQLDFLAAVASQIGQFMRRMQDEDALRRHASLLDLTHDTVLVRDMNDVITFWNRGAEEQYGWTREEAHGHATHDLLRTVFPAPLDQITAELARTGRWEGELIQTRRDGSKIVVASRWALQLDARAQPLAVMETNNDVTERKRAEAELRESERRHRHIFQTAGVSIWEEDFTRVKAAIDELEAGGIRSIREHLRKSPQFVREAISLVRIVDVNEATLKLFGARSRDELMVSLQHVFTPDADEVFAGELVAIAEGRSSFEGETVLQTLGGERIAVLFSVSFPPADSAFDSVLVSIVDITDRKRAEQALEELAGRLIHAQEEERSRIGRELHDHISQTLGVLTIKIDQLRAEPIPDAVAGALDDLRQDTVEITDDVHRLSHRLHSSTLDYLGLVPALQKLVTEFSERHGIDIDFGHAALPAPLPSEVALCLFRVTEEALANIVKHSHARSAQVYVNGAPDGIHLSVEDAGTGFDMTRLEKGAGLGFVSMQERLRVLHGTVRVDSAPARGTRVDAWIPAASVQAATPSEATH